MRKTNGIQENQSPRKATSGQTQNTTTELHRGPWFCWLMIGRGFGSQEDGFGAPSVSLFLRDELAVKQSLCHLQQELAAPEINAAEALCRPCARSCQAKVLSWILAFLAGSCSYRRQVGHALKFTNKRSADFFWHRAIKKIGVIWAISCPHYTFKASLDQRFPTTTQICNKTMAI